MIFLLYFLKVFLYSGILFGYYWLFLRNRRFHHYNRYYLLATLVLSVTLPFIKIPVFNEGSGVLNQAIYQTVSIVAATPGEPVAAEVPAQAAPLFTITNLTWLLYTAGVLVLLFLFARALWQIRRITLRYPYELIRRLKFYQTQEPGTPFSFFRSVFWNDQLSFNSPEGQQVFRHELFHVQQRHSVDIILAELITIAGWFNPFFHLIRKELKAIHEFLADQYATSGSDRYAYAEMLVRSIIQRQNLPLTHPFFQNHLKRRITMIIQHNNNRYGYLSRLMVLPVSLLLFFSLALYAGDKKKTALPVNNQPVTDTIPAGEQRAILELKLKAEQEAISNQKIRLEIKQKAEQEIVQSQRMRLELKRKAEKEEVENRQLILQKILAEKNALAANEKVNTALQRELLELKIKEESLQQTQKKVITLHLKQDINRQLEEKQAMERERELLLLQQQDLQSNKDNKKEYQQQLKLITEKKQMVDLIIKANAERYAAGNINTNEEQVPIKLKLVLADTMERSLIRYLNRNSRFPEIARNNAGEGTIYCSVFIDEDGKFNDFKTYDELPEAAGGHYSEVVTVSYPEKGHVPGNVSEAEIRKAFKAEAERIFQKNPGIATHGKVPPKLYFFKLTFRLEQNK
jgi:beta-lactamase regulating signal transducer with metallopeptidase domain